MPAHPSGVLHAGPSPVWLPVPSDVNELMASLWSRNTVKNSDGVLEVAGVPVTQFAERFGSPLYVLDVDDFRHRAHSFVEEFSAAFAAQGMEARAYYAGKAFLCTAVARWAHEEGMGVDTCSLGEMRTAQAAGVPAQAVGLHGNNKSDDEIAMALDWGIGRIVIDSLDEIERVSRAAAARGITAPVMLRLTVGVEAHTHSFIATAHEDQKFGLSISGGAADQAARAVIADPHLEFVGLHSHIGSQIFEKDGFALAARKIIEFSARLREDTGFVVPEIDLGGGFGIRYTSQDKPVSFAQMAGLLAAAVAEECDDADFPRPAVSFEPGRAIVGQAVFSLYTAGTIKEVETGSGIRTYVSVDGGMSDNIRTALYDADYSCTLASRSSDAKATVVRVVGKHCESGDIVVRDEYLPADISRGDLIAVPGTGAYCRPLSSNYNHVPRPGVVAVEDGQAEWVVLPETYEQMFASDPGFARANENGEK